MNKKKEKKKGTLLVLFGGQGQMVLNSRENAERRSMAVERSIAVAVDKDKTSHYALKWAVDNLVPRYQTLKLVHVKCRPTIPAQNDGTMMDNQIDNQATELFLPFRCYSRRKRVECDSVVLEDVDVAKALIEYVCQNGIETLLLGSGSKTGLVRLFKSADIPGSVLKWTPDFCTVYVISKGKISGVRNATRPLPLGPALGAAILRQRNVIPNEPSSIICDESWFDELSTPENDNLLSNPERLSTDSSFFAFYENLGSERIHDTSSRQSVFKPPTPLIPVPPLPTNDIHFPTSSSFQLEENLVDKVRLEKELKQTMEMYHAACKEVFMAKQKAKELEQWKINEEKRLQVAKEAVHKDSRDAGEAVQKLFEMEVQKRVKAEMKALREGEEKRVLSALGISPMAVKYQSIFHITVVLSLFYFYFYVFG